MITFLVVLHVLVCILLVLLVLIQFGKGAESGWSSQSGAVFTPSGRGNFLTKLTTVLAIVFMANSFIISNLKSKDAQKSLFDEQDASEVVLPGQQEAPSQESKKVLKRKIPSTSKK